MVEKETLIDKIEKHPRIWLIAALLLSALLIVSGIVGLIPAGKADYFNDDAAAHGFRVKANVVGCDDSFSFEKRNTFCRYIPTGVEYFYYVYTEDGGAFFVRADSDFAKSCAEQGSVSVNGRITGFSKDEKKYVNEELALEGENFVDLVFKRIFVLRIAAGMLLLITAALGAALIKKLIPAEGTAYKTANLVFCAMPLFVAALVIYLVGFV